MQAKKIFWAAVLLAILAPLGLGLKAPLALAVIGGAVISTFLTFLVVPKATADVLARMLEAQREALVPVPIPTATAAPPVLRRDEA